MVTETYFVSLELLRSCETMDNKKLAFNYLKRDSVRLLGAMCYKDRHVQDKVSKSRGISRYTTGRTHG